MKDNPRYNKHYASGLLFIIFYFLFSMTLASCADWDDHYEGAVDGGAAGGTLWEQLKANPQVSDFCEVLEQTKVYRMHKKTPVSYADILSGGQAFTVMAPVNGTFNKDSLLRLVQTVVGDSSVEKSFVQNHLSRQLVSSNSNTNKLLMMNMKHLEMANGKVDDVTISTANAKASNGVLHVVEKALPYKHNLFEMFCDNPDLSVIGENLRRFNEDVFDATASVSNGVIDGVPVYVDSVVYERNRLLEAIGLLRDEDSTYLVVAPTTDGWNEAYAEASQYFVFDETIEKRDSLQQYYTLRALLEDAVFNMTDQKNINDSLVSVPYIHSNQQYAKGKHVYHVFQNPWAEGGILYGATPLECSNGILYTTSKWSFNPTDTYFKELTIEGESQYLMFQYDEKRTVYNVRQLVSDSISNGSYMRINAKGQTDNWDVTYRLNNTLSGSYDMYVVVLPKYVYDATAPKANLPCKFKANINYIDAQGKAQTFACKIDNKTEFTTDPARIDTVLIANGFQFPACNYGQDNTSVSINIQCSVGSRQNNSYSREFYLDCILVRPHDSEE